MEPVWQVTVTGEGRPKERYYRAESREAAARAFGIPLAQVSARPLASHVKLGNADSATHHSPR